MHTNSSWEFFFLQPRLPKTAQNWISVLQILVCNDLWYCIWPYVNVSTIWQTRSDPFFLFFYASALWLFSFWSCKVWYSLCWAVNVCIWQLWLILCLWYLLIHAICWDGNIIRIYNWTISSKCQLSALYILVFKLVYGQFEKIKIHHSFDFCPRPSRKALNVS